MTCVQKSRMYIGEGKSSMDAFTDGVPIFLYVKTNDICFKHEDRIFINTVDVGENPQLARFLDAFFVDAVYFVPCEKLYSFHPLYKMVFKSKEDYAIFNQLVKTTISTNFWDKFVVGALTPYGDRIVSLALISFIREFGF